MRKKYLSALLFGALLVTSAGTFTSCKDYDDEINNLQEQITDLQTAVKSLEELVNAGKYVTAVEKTAEGIKFTFNQGDPVVIALEEAAQEGQVFELRDGEIYVDNEPTGIKPAKDPEKAPVKVENGVWMFLNAEGEYESTDIPVSGVNVSGSEEEGFILEIIDANGNSQKVEIPTANSLVSSVSFAIPGTQGTDLYTATEIVTNKDKDIYLVDGTKVSKGAVVSAINKDGSKGVYVNVVVTPSNVDPADLKFSLVNSDGETIFANGVVSQPSTLTSANTRAMDGVYTLHFALKDGLSQADLKDNKIIGDNDLLAVNCGKATTDFVYKYNDNFTGEINTSAGNITTNENYVNLGEEYSIFGQGYKTSPTTDADAEKQDFITAITNVSSVKLTIDKNYADVYGISIDETGTKFTISKNHSGAETEITFKLVYTDVNSTDNSKLTSQTKDLKVKIAEDKLVSSNVIEATHKLTTDNTSTTDVNEEVALLPLADFIASLSSAEKIVWNEATSASINQIANNTTGATGIKLTSSKEYGATPATLDITSTLTLYKSDKKTTTNKPSEAAYIGIVVDPETANVTADTYSGEHQISFGSVKKNVTIKLTLTNPTTLTRIASLFDGDNVVAYGTGNGYGAVFDVLSVYETTNAQYSTPDITKIEKGNGMADTDIANWIDAGGTILNITTDQLYDKTAKVTIEAPIFAGATNNKFKDVIYITAKSPVKEGTVEAVKTTLELGQSNEVSFVNADFVAKDVFGTQYNLFAIVGDNPLTDDVVETDYRLTMPATDKISKVEFSSSTSLVKVNPTYAYGGTDYGFMSGFKVKVSDSAQLQNGDKVTVTVKITDKWGIVTTKNIDLTVVK